MAEERVQVVLHLDSIEALDGLDVDNGCMPFRKHEDGRVDMVAVVTTDTLAELQRRGAVAVEVVDDRAEARRASAEVSRTNRYADGSLPAALGLKGVDRVD